MRNQVYTDLERDTAAYRSTDFTKLANDFIHEMLACGVDKGFIARKLGITRQTFYSRERKHTFTTENLTRLGELSAALCSVSALQLKMADHIRQSNLIENIDDPEEDRRSLAAWGWLIQQPKITQAVLLELHKRITANQLLKEDAGFYRRVDVRVGAHYPPSPIIATAMIHNWLLDLTHHWKALDPKEMHIAFEQIHPFVDGNGRTGRMLMWWHERKLGREPTLLRSNKADRSNYYSWFKTKKENI